MKFRHFTDALCAASLFLFSTTSNAVLVDNGGGLIYDTVLDITWAQPDTTIRDWNDANAWVAGLTLGGVSGWRLPALGVNAMGQPGCAVGTSDPLCLTDELGYMFYNNMSGIVGSSVAAIGDPDLALFPGLNTQRFWTSEQFGTDTSKRWIVNYALGTYTNDAVSSTFFAPRAWAVHDGNISGVVPVPAAFWLFGSALLGLTGLKRRLS